MIKLKEIYGNPLPPKDAANFVKQQTANIPVYSDVEHVKKASKKALLEISKAVKGFVQFIIKKDVVGQNGAISFIIKMLEDLNKICAVWASNLTVDNPSFVPEMREKLSVIENHLNQLISQLRTAAESLDTYGHVINANNEIKHWFEILAATNKDLNEFFDFIKSKETEIK